MDVRMMNVQGYQFMRGIRAMDMSKLIAGKQMIGM